MKKEDVVRSDPDFLSGMPRFVGTRVPIKALFDYIEGGETLDEFLEDFPGVTREQASTILEEVTGVRRRLVHSDSEIMSGEPVFVGTRVPVQSLFDWLEGGDSLDYWLENFPSVKREQAIAVLEMARDSVMASARST